MTEKKSREKVTEMAKNWRGQNGSKTDYYPKMDGSSYCLMMADFAIEYASQQRWVEIHSNDDLPTVSGDYVVMFDFDKNRSHLCAFNGDPSLKVWQSGITAYLPTPIPEYKRKEQK